MSRAEDDVDEASAQPHRPTLPTRIGRGLRELVVVIVLGLVVSTLLRTFVFQMFEIPSESMQNTLQIGDRVAVQKVMPFQRGDIVVFEDPGTWIPSAEPEERDELGKFLEFIGILPNSSQNYLIKRVIGMPGDVVICCDTQGRILVNGQPLDERKYLYSENGEMVAPADRSFEVTVPAGRIFVMGDHRNASADSRCHLADLSGSGGVKGDSAFIPTTRVVGVAFAVAYPWNRFQALTRDETFKTIPPAAHPAPAEPSIAINGTAC